MIRVELTGNCLHPPDKSSLGQMPVIVCDLILLQVVYNQLTSAMIPLTSAQIGVLAKSDLSPLAGLPQ